MFLCSAVPTYIVSNWGERGGGGIWTTGNVFQYLPNLYISIIPVNSQDAQKVVVFPPRTMLYYQLML